MDELSNRYKTLLFLYLLTWFTLSIAGLIGLLGGALEPSPAGFVTKEMRDYLHYACAGCVGGSLYALRMFHQHYDHITLRFVYWYSMRPVLCAGTGLIVVILFDSGIILLQVSDTLAAKIGLAFLSGFGYGKFMEKLTVLTDALFNGKHESGKQQDNRSDADAK